MPAIDALTCKFRQVIPSFKKKKGGLPPDVDQLQKTLFNGWKGAIKELVGIIEKIPAEVEASVSEKYHVDVLSAVCDKIPYLGAAEVPKELKDLCTAKAQELSQEKKVSADRYAEINGMVVKQLKSVVDLRMKV